MTVWRLSDGHARVRDEQAAVGQGLDDREGEREWLDRQFHDRSALSINSAEMASTRGSCLPPGMNGWFGSTGSPDVTDPSSATRRSVADAGCDDPTITHDRGEVDDRAKDELE